MKAVLTSPRHAKRISLLTYGYANRIVRRSVIIAKSSDVDIYSSFWEETKEDQIRKALMNIDISRITEIKSWFRNADEVDILRIPIDKQINFLLSLLGEDRHIFFIILRQLTLIVPTCNFVHLYILLKKAQDNLGVKHLMELLHSGGKYAEIIASIKEYSNRIKAGYKPGSRNLVEAHALNGYMTLPNKDFNIDAAVRQLALQSGIKDHGFDGFTWDNVFKHQVDDMLRNRKVTVVRIDDDWSYVEYDGEKKKILNNLRSFVLLGDWMLPGSANLGKVTYFVDDVEITVKANKNMILDLFDDVNDLVNLCMSTVKQESIAFPKNEFAKVRIVVGSDVLTMIKMKYLQQYFGIVVEHLRGLSFRDTPEYFERLATSLQYGMSAGVSMCSFDFSAFERQPTYNEMQSIYNAYMSIVPSSEKSVIDNVLSGLKEHYLYYRDEHGKRVEYQQKAGVPSGIAWTTLLGGTWNIAVFNTVAALLGVDKNEYRCAKGDDSVIGNRDNLKTLTVISGALELGIEANPSVFQLSGINADGEFNPNGCTAEFLRRSISTSGVTGYPSRSLVHMVEFKPWSREGDPVWGVTDGIVNSLLTVCRRMGINFREIISRYRPMLSQIANRGLTLLQEFKGYGLMINNWLSISQSENLSLKCYAKLSGAREQQLRAKFQNAKLDYKRLFNSLVPELLSQGDIPNYRKMARESVKKSLVNAKFTQIKIDQVKINEKAYRSSMFGSKPWLSGKWTELMTIQRYSTEPYSAFQTLKRDDPGTANDIVSLYRRFRFSRGQAIDWLSGKVPYLSRTVVAPSLASDVSVLVAANIEACGGFKNCRDVRHKVIVANKFLVSAEVIVEATNRAKLFRF